MGDLLIRDVDDNLLRLLKRKAELNGTSLQQEASRALKRGAPLSPAERGVLLKVFHARWGGARRFEAIQWTCFARIAIGDRS